VPRAEGQHAQDDPGHALEDDQPPEAQLPPQADARDHREDAVDKHIGAKYEHERECQLLAIPEGLA